MKVFKILLIPVVLACSPLVNGHPEHENEKAEQELTEILGIFKEHLIKQLAQTNNWVGDDAVMSLSMHLELLKASETTETDPVRHMQEILVTIIKLKTENIDKICEAKTYKPAQERCFKTLNKAYEYLDKYDYLK